MRPDTNQMTTGDCECCDRINVAVVRRHNSLMCAVCAKLEDDAIAKQKAIDTIEKSHEIDATIQLEKDIWNAATVPFTELKAAIDNNPDIPADQKDYALFKEADNRIKQYDTAIIATKTTLMNQQNERHAWVKNAQDLAAKLQGTYREKAKQHDLTFLPSTIGLRKYTHRPRNMMCRWSRSSPCSFPRMVCRLRVLHVKSLR